jgi:hypothetical protein
MTWFVVCQKKSHDDRASLEKARMIRDHKEVLQRVTAREYNYVRGKLQVQCTLSMIAFSAFAP